MPVFFNDDTRILFIHIPKTGGTFITEAFRKNGFSVAYEEFATSKGKLNEVRKCSPQHMHRDMLRSIFDLNKFDFIFMTVRNPLNRLISEFRWRNENEPVDVNEWIASRYHEYSQNPFILDNHLRPQYEFFVEEAKFYRQDDKFDSQWSETFYKDSGIELDLSLVKPKIRVSESKLSGSDVLNKMNKESLKTITEWYYRDFVDFNYPFPLKPPLSVYLKNNFGI